jgi:hypothetical protein
MDANKIVEMLTQILQSISTGGKVLQCQKVVTHPLGTLKSEPRQKIVMEAGYSIRT